MKFAYTINFCFASFFLWNNLENCKFYDFIIAFDNNPNDHLFIKHQLDFIIILCDQEIETILTKYCASKFYAKY